MNRDEIEKLASAAREGKIAAYPPSLVADLARAYLAEHAARVDADMAQAALVERAANVVQDMSQSWRIREGLVARYRLHPDPVSDAIRRLAPASGVEALAALRAQLARKDQAIEAWREDLTNERADRDALAAKLAESEAQVAALRGAAKEARTDLMICADNVRDAAKTNPRWEGTAEVLMARCRQIDAVLAAAQGAKE